MRLKSTDDVKKLGPAARRQVESILEAQGGFNNMKRPGNASDVSPKTRPEKMSGDAKAGGKKKKERVMRTHEGMTYCPWPATDPFVAVHQRLEKAYGMYHHGGMLINEMIIDGGEKDWRFDLVLLPKLKKITVIEPDGTTRQSLSGPVLIAIESDGYGPHRSKEAFKNDRTKQTHALKNGFIVKRITTEDARERLEQVIRDVGDIMAHQRFYDSDYTISPKGKTQAVFSWSPKS